MPPALANVPTLPTVDIPDVELCRVGLWNGHTYSRQDLADAAATWADLKGQWDVPLTLGHDGESALGDGEPAYGWVDDVRLEGDTLKGTYRKVPQKLASLIKSGAYAKRSCTFLPDIEVAGKLRRLVLRNVALLGRWQPAVDGLEDIASLYNVRRLAAADAPTLTLVSEAAMTAVNAAELLARLWPDRRQLASGPSQDSIRAAVQAALNAAGYEPSQPADEGATPGATPTPSSTIVMLFSDAVVVNDNDEDAFFEIPVSQDGATVTLGNPQMVELRPTPISGTPSEESEVPGDAGEQGAADAADASGAGGSPPAAAPAGAAAEQMARQLGAALRASNHAGAVQLLLGAEPDDYGRIITLARQDLDAHRLAAAVADSAVEDLISEASAEFDKLLAGVNAIAAGKPGVSEFRTLLEAAKKSMARIKVAKPASSGTNAPPKPVQNARQEDSDVKLSQLAKIYGLPETATEDEVMRAAEGAAASRDVVLTLARKVDTLIERDAEKDIEAKLTAAVSEGRLKRWNKPGEDGTLYTTLRTLARTDMRTAETMIAALSPIVDTNEYGRSGSDQGAPETALSPGVAAELRRLGRDPATISTERLGDRWKREREAHIAEHNKKLGMPARR